MLSAEGVLLVVFLWCVQLLQSLSQQVFPAVAHLLDRLVSHLQARRRHQLATMEDRELRTKADRGVVRFMEERGGRYHQLQRYGDVGT